MKKCAVINDLSGFGKCSLGAAIPIISSMGCEVHPLPTAVLSNQTAYDSYDIVSLTDSMGRFIEQWKKLGASFDAILTGFVCDEKQIDIINAFADDFKADNTIFVVDPVMADNGSLYDCYTSVMCEKIKRLCYKADVITPNTAELAFIAEEPYSENIDDIKAYCLKLINNGIKNIVVTGLKKGDKISNVVYDRSRYTVIAGSLSGGYFSGTGDIFASIITGGLMRGLSVVKSAELATNFISTCACDSKSSSGNDGVNFEKFLYMLTNYDYQEELNCEK
ncbi:MAG: pyridoxamine kinase [Eubacterium sp.]|nr:pyridoxamine kinase [Eubacterium sp.]